MAIARQSGALPHAGIVGVELWHVSRAQHRRTPVHAQAVLRWPARFRMHAPLRYADCEAPQNSALSAAPCQVLRGALVRVCTDCFRIIPGAADRPTLAHRTGAVAARSTRLAPLRIECHRLAGHLDEGAPSAVHAMYGIPPWHATVVQASRWPPSRLARS